MAADTDSEQCVGSVRSFNRFYTAQIGVLHKEYLKSGFSLAEVRVLYELAHQGRPTATQLAAVLRLDPGYLSRILVSFEKSGLIRRTPSDSDRRQSHVVLTAKGRKAFAPLDARAHREIAALVAKLSPAEQVRLTEAMHTIEKLLGTRAEPKTPYLLRPHQPGDMGWVIHRHGALYAQEYGWDEQFEALVAEIAAKFIRNFDSRRERCWIAEKDASVVGSVFLVKHSDEVAKLRLLLVEPQARGLGIGKRLVNECIRFARQAGYKKITLWTQSLLVGARHIYEQAGFRLVQEAPHNSFGHDLVAETWELML